MPFFNNNGIKIYYEISGEGEPLLLINGLGSDTRQWALLKNAIKPDVCVITYDMRCVGKSDKPLTPFSISDLSSEALALLEHLGYKKASILGFSMGGAVAMRLAIDHPEVIDKLFLVSTAASLPNAISSKMKDLFSRTDVSEELLKEVYDAVFGSGFRKKFSALEYIKFRMSDDSPQPLDAYLNQLRACMETGLDGRIERIKAPTVIVAGDEDKIVPATCAHHLNEHIKDSKLHILKGVGHMVAVEAPENLAKILNTNKRFIFQ